MNDQNNHGATKNSSEISAQYEAPRIEEIVTAQNLEREVQYAGFQSQPR